MEMDLKESSHPFYYAMLTLVAFGIAPVLFFNGSFSTFILNEGQIGLLSDDAILIFRIGQMVSFCLTAIFSSRLFPLYSRQTAMVIIILGCFVSGTPAALVPLIGFGQIPDFLLILVSSFITGVLSAVINLAWLELICKLTLPSVIFCFSMAYTITGFLSIISSALGAVLGNLFVLILPLLALPIYLYCIHNNRNEPFQEGEKEKTGWTFPTKPVVLMAMIAFANTFIRTLLPHGANYLAAFGSIIAAGAVLVAVLVRKERFEPRLLYTLALPLIIAAALSLMVLMPDVAYFGSLLSNAAFNIFIIFICTALCSMVFRYGINPLWLFGIVFAARTASSSIVAFLWKIFRDQLSTTEGMIVLMAVVIMLLVSFYPFVLTKRDLESSWGLRLEGSAGDSSYDEMSNSLTRQCMLIARRYGLTHREEEIMFFLAQDMTLPSIAEKLCVTNATVKSHANHVYKKLGVHSKKDLISLVDTS